MMMMVVPEDDDARDDEVVRGGKRFSPLPAVCVKKPKLYSQY
jgi:hypothetical protein